MVKNRMFREDLCYGLTVISLNVPSLRERKALNVVAMVRLERQKFLGSIELFFMGKMSNDVILFS